MTTGQSHDSALRQIREAVDRWGVCLQFVPQPTLLETSWYTVGLTGRGHPELIVFGLRPEVARRALNTLADGVITGLRAPRAGQSADDVLDGYTVRFIAVEDAGRHLPAATRLYPGQVIEALQIVWPDRHHRWPWDTGTTVDAMPVLGAHDG